jgi:hypothetical protein
VSVLPPDWIRIAGDIVIAAHAGFVVVILGGVLALWWRRLIWLHLPAAAWGILIEFTGWICPLTPLENYLRERSGMVTYQGDFIQHDVVALLYPIHLTRGRQTLLGSFALAVNAIVYWYVFRRRRTR